MAFSLPHSPSEAEHPPNCTPLLVDQRKCASLLQPPSLLLPQPSEHQSLPGENPTVNTGQKEVLQRRNASLQLDHRKPLCPKQPLEVSITLLLLSRTVQKQQAKEELLMNFGHVCTIIKWASEVWYGYTFIPDLQFFWGPISLCQCAFFPITAVKSIWVYNS